jgi:beta-glucosidase-like glycosyl hydrolase
MLLAPTVCMHRHPLGGRNFESFSEDPVLTGKLAAMYIRGLQDKGVAATIKRMKPCHPHSSAHTELSEGKRDDELTGCV